MSGKRCSIDGCNSFLLDVKIHVTLHRVPKHPLTRQKWLDTIKRLNNQIVDETKLQFFYVCDFHFEKKYKKNFAFRTDLTKDAVPTIFKPDIAKKVAKKILVENDEEDESLASALCRTDDSEDEKQDRTVNVSVDEPANKDLEINSPPRNQPVQRCQVPQCETRDDRPSNNIRFFQIPRYIRSQPPLLEKWSKRLCLELPFPDDFKICSLHFEPCQILKPVMRDSKQPLSKTAPVLVHNALPRLKLPKISVHRAKQISDPVRATAQKRRASPSETTSAKKTQEPEVFKARREYSKPVSVCIKPHIAPFSSFCDTDEKLRALTGLDDLNTLDALITECEELNEEENCQITIKDRIILTMCRLKTNFSFVQLAVLFCIDVKVVISAFNETLKNLAEIVRHSIYWPSIDENSEELPSFRNFPKARTLIECLSISNSPNLAVLLAFSPTGEINYISDVFSSLIPHARMLQQTDLLKLLQPGEAIIISEDFESYEETLREAQIEMIKAESSQNKLKVAAARANIDKQIQNLRSFKIFADSLDASLVQVIGFIMVVLCGLLNINTRRDLELDED